MNLSPSARRRIATVLSLVLAVESVSAVSVAATTFTTTTPGEATGAPAATAAHAVAADARDADRLAVRPVIAAPVAERVVLADPPVAIEAATRIVSSVDLRPAAPGRVAEERHAPRADPSKPAPAAKATAPAAKDRKAEKAQKVPKAQKAERPPRVKPATELSGTNRMWIPALGITKSVRWFPCERSRPPDNFMYRWGCAGSNNVYLMGHAHSVMKPLHDAYVRGRLQVGLKAYYAGSDGRVHKYAVRWWKVVRPTPDAAWAWAPQSVPSMTLQTCVGKNSEFRLMVRLVEVDG